VKRKNLPAMTTNWIKSNAETLETLLQRESELYRQALKNDVPFKFIKAIHLRVKRLSRQLQTLKANSKFLRY
jgi:hypothetical protein